MRPPPPRAAAAQRGEQRPGAAADPSPRGSGGRARCPAPRVTCRDGREGLYPRAVIASRHRAALAAGSGRGPAGEGDGSADSWRSPVLSRRWLTAGKKTLEEAVK